LLVRGRKLGGRRTAQKVKSLIRSHHRWRRKCINLIASENVASPSVREVVACDFLNRYAEYEDQRIDKRWDEGSSYVIEVEKIAQDLAKGLFNARFVELRPISGQMAITSVICSLAKLGSTVFEVNSKDGGHGWSAFSGSQIVDYKPDFYIFDHEEWNIDVDASAKRIKESKPSLLILGSSYYLFPPPVEELKEVAEEAGALVVCDDAHVLGLIAGKRWPNPLRMGATVLVGSTHKTFPGPQRGLALTDNKEIAEKIAKAIYPALLTNHHLNDLAALSVALAEFEEFGEGYAEQVVDNAKALGEALSEEGFDVVAEHKGFTESHQVLVKTTRYVRAAKASKMLKEVNIIANKMELNEANGLRIGTSEVTRVGMKEADMKEVARFIGRTLIGKENFTSIKKDVTKFMHEFQKMHYSFDMDKPAYKYFEFRD
jgi:glycine hydroxymethyltransferase